LKTKNIGRDSVDRFWAYDWLSKEAGLVVGVKLGIKGGIPFCPIGQALKVPSGELGENPFFRSHACCLKAVYLGVLLLVLLLLAADGAMSLETVDHF
jgi:hypothetical protein